MFKSSELSSLRNVKNTTALPTTDHSAYNSEWLALEKIMIGEKMLKCRILFFIALFCCITSWKLPTTMIAMKKEAGDIRKIAIVGSGIAGMGAAACLKVLGRNYPSSALREIDIFESRRNYLQSQLGGGVQLSGGAAVIEKLGYYDELMSTAKKLEGITCRDSYDKILYDINIKRSIERRGRTELISSSSGESLFCTVMRDALLSLLHNISTPTSTNPALVSLPNNSTQTVSSPKVSILPEHRCLCIGEDNNKQLQITCADHRYYKGYDIVLLADGVNSLLQQPELGFKDILGRSLDRPVADTGIRITYCVLPDEGTSASLSPSNFQQFMGDGVYALIGQYGGLNQRSYSMLAIVYKDEQEGQENVEWSLSPASENAIRAKLKKGRLDHNLSIQQILQRLFDNERAGREEYRIFDLSVKNRIIPLSSWSSMDGRVILLGDCAHSMAPFFGQGANQALQDAYCLASLIHQYNHSSDRRGLEEVISKEYERRRKWSVSKLVAKSYLLGQLETLGGSVGAPMKDLLFQTLFQLGITEKELLEAASPNI